MNIKKLSIAVVLLIFAGCAERTPPRTHIPVLKENLYKLQTAVKEQNRSSIDSLLSPVIFDKEQNSDSLLSLVYGPDGSFPFESFGNADIFYTQEKARISCYIMDSTHTTDRELVIYYIYDHDLWLVSSFKAGEEIPEIDSSDTE